MKEASKWLRLAILLAWLLCLGGCTFFIWSAIGSEERHGPEHYQYTWEVVQDWNLHTTNDREDLLGYGEYLYNSYLALFPRETPSTLTEYYFTWDRSMDVDYWGAYFTCEMTPENYAAFAKGLADFTVTTEQGTVSPLLDTVHFAHPAYILQWLDEGQKWEVLEYVMLDEVRHAAVFVYTMGRLEQIEANSACTVTPTTMDILAPADTRTDYRGLMSQSGFTIYEDFTHAVYDLSFLDYLK